MKNWFRSVVVTGIVASAFGCGSSKPGELDAATEEAMKAEMSRVESAEQEHFRQNPPAAAPVQQVEEGANFSEPSF